MKTAYLTLMTETNIMKFIKLLLALVIIAMGSYGYHRFFASEGSSEPIWLVVILFIVIEAAILTMTTIKFSTALKQAKSIGVGLTAAITVMWLISGVGIDQTIWGMVESKYHTVKKSESAMLADKETEALLFNRIKDLESQQALYTNEITQITKIKLQTQGAYDITARQLKNVIWYGGKRCDLSTDCTARKVVAQNALHLKKQELDDYTLTIKSLKQNALQTTINLEKSREKIEAIVAKRVDFETNNRLTLNNKIEEGIVHVKLMEFMNSVLGLQIQTPERAYVMLLSFIIYPIYILFIAFMYSNSVEMRDFRQKEQDIAQKKFITQIENRKQNNNFSILITYLRKIIAYQISTRKRKVITKEIPKIVEVIKEVDRIVYKDGKEVVKVNVEVPYIIEKEVVVEKIVEKLVVEKEFITVPADIDLNELNKLTGHGSVPKDLEDVLRKINDEMKDKILRGANNHKYRSA